MNQNNETKQITTEVVINDASLITSFNKKDGKYTIGDTKFIINISNFFELKDALNRICQEIQSECDNLNKIENGKASAVDILRAINNTSENISKEKKCEGTCSDCKCEHEKNPSVVKGTNFDGLSGIIDYPKTSKESDYSLVDAQNVTDFSSILAALSKYVERRYSVTFRQLSKAFYERTRNFCKANNISEEGFTMQDWKELFESKKTEIITKHGLFVNSNGHVMFTSVGRFVKPAGSISG